MTGLLAGLMGVSQDVLWHGFLVFLRVGAIMALMPGFGDQSVPLRVKLGLGLCFTAIVAPAVSFEAAGRGDYATFAVTETIAGLAVGIGMRMFIFALQTAGSIAAQVTSLSQILGGAGAEPMPAIGHVLVISGTALAVLMGLHIKAAQLIVLSYDFLPFGQFPDARSLSSWGVTQVSRAFALAFQLAAPFVLVSAIYNLTLGVINRAMPQLMVAFVGAPLITAGGLALLLIVSPVLLSIWIDAFDLFLVRPFGSSP